MSDTMVEQDSPVAHKIQQFNEHVDRCLSMIMHYEEAQQIAEIVKKIYAERLQETSE